MAVLKPAKVKITIYQGATYEKDWEWKDKNGVVVNLTGYTARMHVRAELEDADTLLELDTSGADEKKLLIGGPTADPTLGIFGIRLSATETANLAWESGVYDLELVNTASGFVRRIIEGKIEVIREVTR